MKKLLKILTIVALAANLNAEIIELSAEQVNEINYQKIQDIRKNTKDFLVNSFQNIQENGDCEANYNSDKEKGVCYFKQNKPLKAYESFDKVAKLDPTVFCLKKLTELSQVSDINDVKKIRDDIDNEKTISKWCKYALHFSK
ncbi:hypothetical protein N5T90_06520 [Aliarcobacter cryaerophilus]|uniref:hypothetical protein n=1 Tax=Aliarcobacter cryaerophilus TaxID=28198 RepID=UPI0021B5841E|nr:hypothetical protein [Aliarcobacter cryaerophilus]MCT7470522.1 hypothetical protein [Aliarcobacter cryaerophilus]